MLHKDYLPGHENITLYQDDLMFRVNTDTYLLGNFIEIKNKDRVLDVGTNNGALLLYASIYNPKELVGIDINKEALDIAKLNLDTNNIKNYKLIHKDIKEYKEDLFDVIISNPPFFKEDIYKQKELINKAKHDDTLKLKDLIKSISINLKDLGRLYLIYHTERLSEVFEELKNNNIAIKELKFIYDSNKENSHVFLLKGVKGAKDTLNVKKPLIIKR